MNLKDKVILVTGADGFIGSHLVEELLDLGCKVKAFVYYNSFNSWGWLDLSNKKNSPNLCVVSGDIRDQKMLISVAEGCDFIFHLAALISIPYSYTAVESYLDTNVYGTFNILEAAKFHNIKRVIITSTSEVYGTAIKVPISESHPRQAQSPYSASKIAADALAFSFFTSYNLPVTVVRPFNTYGPRQSARAIIPTIITQILLGERSIKLGDLTPTRDLVYVKDTVLGFIEVLKTDTLIGQECNISTNVEYSIFDVFAEISNQLNVSLEIINDPLRHRPKKSEVFRLLGDNKKILQSTSWKPRYSLSEGIRETIDWFKVDDNLRRYKGHIYNL